MSTFTWIDHSETQRRQLLEAIETFREKGTRDELGISGVRDAFSDMLFPGTGALQTRARYFFFVPWMYLDFEARRVPASEADKSGRVYELGLIDRLSACGDHAGTIGIRAKGELQRLPSNIYWNGLRTLGIAQFAGTQSDYHRSLDRRRTRAAATRTNDDGEVLSPVGRAWHAGMPSAPDGFPQKADFALRVSEARYLRGRIIENHRGSLFAHLADQQFKDADADFAWEHPGVKRGIRPELQREVDHARCFSEVINGATILYNLFLAELDPPRTAVIEPTEQLFGDWLQVMSERSDAHHAWDRQDFWRLLATRGYVASTPTRTFIDTWFQFALSGSPVSLRRDESARSLIFNRETSIKGQALARCRSSRAREKWQGDAGLGRLEYRWFNVRVILRDIMGGLGESHA